MRTVGAACCDETIRRCGVSAFRRVKTYGSVPTSRLPATSTLMAAGTVTSTAAASLSAVSSLDAASAAPTVTVASSLPAVVSTAVQPYGVRGLQLSSDTIASTHRRYRHRGIDVFWEALTPEERERYDRGFYTIGGFIVFPRRRGSLNQRRGTAHEIDDRFDLTLECIRRYYEGLITSDSNPLGDTLLADKDFFDLFGQGAAGFTAYVNFFHLAGLVDDGRVRWFDEHDAGDRVFTTSPLPKTLDEYVRYLDNVLAFVETRNGAIASATGLIGRHAPVGKLGIRRAGHSSTSPGKRQSANAR